MDTGLMSFTKMQLDEGFLTQIWSFSPKNLGSLDDLTVSMYSVALAQYLVYFKSEQNKTKAELAKKKKYLETSVALAVDKEIAKVYKTKAAQTEFFVSTNADLAKLSDDIDDLQLELIKIDGMDKAITEYIATFKRELGRREKELYTTRSERK